MASNSICQIDECGKRVVARGWCDAHYMRWKRHGDPQAGRVAHGEPMRWLLAHVRHSDADCLIWPFGVSREGYGKVAQAERWRNASRVMCEIAHGAAPSPVHQACHSCGNGHEACVNPSHLYWGTPAENAADKEGHGTANKGEACASAKLTANQVREIRQLSRSTPQVAVASQFGISPQRVSKIVRRQQWVWLE